MKNSKQQLWKRFQKHYTEFPALGLAVDISRMNFSGTFFKRMHEPIQAAFTAMAELEKGSIANPDENRMVGHYWLRNPALAPSEEIRVAIEQTIEKIKQFAADVHIGKVCGANGPFKNVLVVGIGGSALGPQFVAHALGRPAEDKCKLFFFDNTDPDGMDKVVLCIGQELGQTLTIVISKSGGTKETRNGMVEAESAYKKVGLNFGAHAVAVTSANSELDRHATSQGWLERFPMWDWVGGRTSELSAVGLLPAALQGVDIQLLLAGAKACDETTRNPEVSHNPAAQLALMWHYIGNGKGNKNMIVLPYKDRLELFSKYLQQLIMESLGKALDLNGNVVNQGISVFGNKGSTDQHAYVQQLRDGRNDFFVTFVEVLKDRSGDSMEVEPGVRSGDYLEGFLLGTRQALYDNDRQSITITVNEVSPFSVGVLIALMERTVGLYARLININAYHQPGVEAGKKAAAAILALQGKTVELLKSIKEPMTAAQVAEQIGATDDAETVFKVLEHLSSNPDRRITKLPGSPKAARFQSH